MTMFIIINLITGTQLMKERFMHQKIIYILPKMNDLRENSLRFSRKRKKRK